MRYKLLGRSGLRVSELCLGTMTFGNETGWGADKEESRRIFDHFAEAGGNFIDTANRYTFGTSEKFTGEFIRAERERFVLATKYTLSSRDGDPNASGNHRKNMVQALEASLQRLNTEYIDLYWLHAWDFTTPVEEVMRAFDDMVRAGKVLHVGVSDTPAWIVSQANTLAQLRGWSPFVGLQIEYNLVERTPERDLLPMARAFGIGVTAWSPLASGLLAGKFNDPQERDPSARLSQRGAIDRVPERNLAIAREVARVAAEVGRTPSQVAIHWLLRQPGGVIPILGARTEAQLADNLGSLDLHLDQDAMEKLDEVSRVDLGFPHEFLARESIRKLVYGGTLDQIKIPQIDQ